MILALKTSDSITKIYLLNEYGKAVNKKTWQAERALADNLLSEIEQIINSNWKDLTGLVVFVGPGSFTGLRIGITAMNTLAYSLNIPIVGTAGDNWVENGIKRLKNNENDRIVMPEYGAEANITKPKK